MKHLLTGVAILAAVAISAPAFAQGAQGGPKPSGGTSAKPTAPAPMAPAMAPAKPAPAAPMAAKRPMRHHHRMAMHRSSPDDTMTEQLNQQELARIQGGGGGMAPAGDRLQGPKVGPK